MLFGDLVSRLSNGPYRAYYGLLWWLMGELEFVRPLRVDRVQNSWDPTCTTHFRREAQSIRGAQDQGRVTPQGWQVKATPEGSSTQYLRTLVPKVIKGMVFSTRAFKYWVLRPSGLWSYLEPWGVASMLQEQGLHAVYCVVSL